MLFRSITIIIRTATAMATKARNKNLERVIAQSIFKMRTINEKAARSVEEEVQVDADQEHQN